MITTRGPARSSPETCATRTLKHKYLRMVYDANSRFPRKNYYWDGVFFARVIEAAPGFNFSLFHPNHLLYNAAGYVLYTMSRAVWIGMAGD